MNPPYYSTGHVILNIGLVRSDNKQPLNPTFIEQYLAHIGLDVREFKLFVSNTEPTAVVVIRPATPLFVLSDRTHKIAEFLTQDAVAFYSPAHGRGELIGPRADNWGEFNPRYFLMPDGRRLSDHNSN